MKMKKREQTSVKFNLVMSTVGQLFDLMRFDSILFYSISFHPYPFDVQVGEGRRGRMRREGRDKYVCMDR